MLVDSHCHLDFPQLRDNLKYVLQVAKDNGVIAAQTICTKISDFHSILAITERFAEVYCSVGNHPCNVLEEELKSPEEIANLCKHEKVIGIGETGLDYYHSNDTQLKIKQRESFINHIRAAQITGLPIIVHTRNADNDTIEILQEQMQECHFHGVIHCFTGSKDLAEKALKLGFYISASGIITFKNATDIQEIFRHTIPLDRILLETDSPFLAPIPYRGKSNQPAWVKEIAIYLAQLKSIDYSTLAQLTTKNFYTLFAKANMIA